MKEVDWNKIRRWIDSAEAEGVLTKEQAHFLRIAIEFVRMGKFDTALKVLSTKQSLRKIQPQLIEGLMDAIGELKAEHHQAELYRVLILTPKNSTPNKPITLIGKYHTKPDETIEIGIRDDCEIVLVDTKSDEDVFVAIRFAEDENDFKIENPKNAPVKWVEKGVLAIDNYLFEIQTGTTRGDAPIESEYNKQFPVNLRLLKYEGEKSRVTTTHQNLEEIGFRILREIEPQGRAHPLARLQNLQSWLNSDYPNVKVESIEMLTNEIWVLIALTTDEKTGIVVPTVDTNIGTKAYQWFISKGYIESTGLLVKNIKSFAKAKFDEDRKQWVPTQKGLIDMGFDLGLVLTPINSKPADAIEIIDKYHIYDENLRLDKNFSRVFKVGKGEKCGIILVDTAIQDDVQALIAYVEDKGFLVMKFGNAEVEIGRQVHPESREDTTIVVKDMRYLRYLDKLQINEYKFYVDMKWLERSKYTEKEYEDKFPVKLRLR